MHADPIEPTPPQPSAEDAEMMKKYGITRVPVEYFRYGEFRYTNLKDAIAQAERSRSQSQS